MDIFSLLILVLILVTIIVTLICLSAFTAIYFVVKAVLVILSAL